MDQAQSAAAMTALVLLFFAAIPVLYYLASASGRRQWAALEPRRRRLFVITLLGWVVWVASTKVVRPLTAATGMNGHWTVDIAPSFIAGVTVTAFSALMFSATRWRSLLSVFCVGATIMLLLELVQRWLPKYVFDPLDVLAGTAGAALIAVALHAFAPRHSETDA